MVTNYYQVRDRTMSMGPKKYGTAEYDGLMILMFSSTKYQFDVMNTQIMLYNTRYVFVFRTGT